MAKRDEEYNWLDDPFDAKKAAQEQQAGMTGRSKVLVGVGCLVIVLVLIVLAVLGVGMLGALAGA